MPLFLEATDRISIQIDFPEHCLPTCNICGNSMNYITIMSDCIYTQREQNQPTGTLTSKLSLEGGTTHIHFHHNHPNASSQHKTSYYCPLYDKRW